MKRASIPTLAGAVSTLIAAALGLLAPGITLETALGTAVIAGVVAAATTAWATQEARERRDPAHKRRDEEPEQSRRKG